MKKKRNIIIILIVLLSIVVTIAYLQSTDTFENIFNAGTYSVVTHEEFTSPDNWAPGDTTNKTITTTNQGTIPVKVRVKLEESWTSSNDVNLPLESNEIQLAIINFANLDDWVKDGDYYYYISELAPGETTSSLLESVTFNPEYLGDINCITVNNVKTCESSSDGYMGGTYTLNITTETVQSDAYQEVWNLSYDPTEERFVYSTTGLDEYETYEETNKNLFLRKTMLGEEVTLTEIGIILNGNIYFLKGGGGTWYDDHQGGNYLSDSIYYGGNKNTLIDAFESENCTEQGSDASFHWFECHSSGIEASTYDYGHVKVYDDYRYSCSLLPDGSGSCIQF